MSSELEKFGVKKKKGEVIFFEWEAGSEVFFIQTGAVRITKVVMGREKTLAVIGPGDIFGEMALLEKAPRSATTIAEEDSFLLKFNQNSFAQLVKKKPSIAVKLLRLLAERIHDQKSKFNIIRLPDNESKIMAVFINMALSEEHNIDEITEIVFDTSIDKIAGWAGMKTSECRQTVKLMQNGDKLTVYENEGKIKVHNIYQFQRIVKSKQKLIDEEENT